MPLVKAMTTADLGEAVRGTLLQALPRGLDVGLEVLVAGRDQPDLGDCACLVTAVPPTAESSGRSMARLANAAGVPNVSLRIGPGDVEVGPFTLPGRSACLDCYRQRLAPEEPVGEADPPRTAPDAATDAGKAEGLVVLLGLALLGLQVNRWLHGYRPPTVARVFSCRISDLCWSGHWVHQIPGCATCRLGSRAGGGR